MIVDRLDNRNFYATLNRDIARGLDFLADTDLAGLELGRHDIEGDRIFALVTEYETKPKADAGWEAHRKYHDIQLVVFGEEEIGYNNLRLMDQGNYDQDKDFQGLQGSGDMIALRPGVFALFTPQDAHAPGLVHGRSQPVRKVVVKVAV